MRILYAIHDYLPRHQAGSELYASYLAAEVARHDQVTVLCAEYDPAAPHGTIRTRRHEGLPVVELVNNWAFRRFGETYSSPRLNQVLGQVLDEARPDVLHVHSLLNLSLDLPRLAAARGVPVVFTLHDHHLVCPAGGQRVHVAARHVCRTIDPGRCGRCFGESPFFSQMAAGGALARLAGPSWLGQTATTLRLPGALRGAAQWLRRRHGRLLDRLVRAAGAIFGGGATITPDEIEQRLAHVRRMYRHVDRFIAPSRALAEEHVLLGLPRDRLQVSDYGFRPFARHERRLRTGRFTIGFVGTLVWHKGAHVLLEAARKLPRDRFAIEVYGILDTFPDYTRHLRELADGLPVRLLGGFANDQAAAIYQRFDVLVVPSLWPENSPLVIHEAFMAGVPIVGARAGGIVDLVDHDRNGLLYDASAPELAAALRALIDDPARLARFRAALPAVKSMAADAAEWRAIYHEVAARGRGRPRADHG